ncbi:MAG: glutamine-hydrolyzing carbamoyl-phosphate synthase small subunit [Flavobacteriales bacterium]|nr:glutamine-hydrolyzing carbamoyl-phosphate synthase small subunit [Flavobacteriales bacterium]
MSLETPQPAYLVLQDGTVFIGKSAGSIGTTTGEIAFNTGMTGYQEIFSDPSYYKQILIMTTSHIGNYGVHEEEIESDTIKVAGIVCKKFSQIASRPGSSGTLQGYLERDGIVGICDLDTRALVRHIRQKGAMNAVISSEITDVDQLKKMVSEIPSMQGMELSSFVSTKQAYDVASDNPSANVALLDLGVKRNIIRCLTERGCNVRVFPHNSTADEIAKWNPDGIMLSNGPGDPAAMPEVVAEIGKLVELGLPTFGICLGHQMIALSQGLTTEKMFNGHRGVNHPVKNLKSGRCEITSQNHGFVVSRDSLADNVQIEETHMHLNDHSVAGIQHKTKPLFSVQYHPEASAGPHDSRYLFDQFVERIHEFKSQPVS